MAGDGNPLRDAEFAYLRTDALMDTLRKRAAIPGDRASAAPVIGSRHTHASPAMPPQAWSVPPSRARLRIGHKGSASGTQLLHTS
jgi:hypothetical protein